jgi:hypothetical protein
MPKCSATFLAEFIDFFELFCDIVRAKFESRLVPGCVIAQLGQWFGCLWCSSAPLWGRRRRYRPGLKLNQQQDIVL